MKKRMAALLLALLLLLAAGSALGDGWVCPYCGQANSYYYCTSCGRPMPQASYGWTCRVCGHTGNEGAYCGVCGTPQYDTEWDDAYWEDDTWDTGRTSWPEMNFYPRSARISPESDRTVRYQSYAGPGRNYATSGAFLPYKVQSLEVYFEENSFVLVHLRYQTVEDRWLYFPRWNVVGKPSDLPVIGSHQTVEAVTRQRIIPRWGPGSNYSQESEFPAEAGIRVQVLFTQNGYAYGEYSCPKGLVRMWLPIEQLDAGSEG